MLFFFFKQNSYLTGGLCLSVLKCIIFCVDWSWHRIVIICLVVHLYGTVRNMYFMHLSRLPVDVVGMNIQSICIISICRENLRCEWGFPFSVCLCYPLFSGQLFVIKLIHWIQAQQLNTSQIYRLFNFLPLFPENFRYMCDICGKKYKYYSCFQEHRDLHAVDGMYLQIVQFAAHFEWHQ